jgi:hypothetical protein
VDIATALYKSMLEQIAPVLGERGLEQGHDPKGLPTPRFTLPSPDHYAYIWFDAHHEFYHRRQGTSAAQQGGGLCFTILIQATSHGEWEQARRADRQLTKEPGPGAKRIGGDELMGRSSPISGLAPREDVRPT